jgi:hypothetical protein
VTGEGPGAKPEPAKVEPAKPDADPFGGLSLETSRAAELHRQGKLPHNSAEAAADARRGLVRWIAGLFRRPPSARG